MRFRLVLLCVGVAGALQRLFGAFDEVDRAGKAAWLAMWSTHVWNTLSTLQQAHNYTALHIYINGDSTLRQQKNFLCSLLQPGYMGHTWPLDVSWGSNNPEATCYNATLNVRVTHIDNPCCDVKRLAFLADHPDTEPGGGTHPPAWLPIKAAAAADGKPVRPVTLASYFNCGLHLLHLGRARPEYHCLHQYVEYMATLSNFSQAASRMYPGTQQVFMTTNSVCEDLFTKKYKLELAAMRDTPNVTADACVARFVELGIGGPHAGDRATLRRVCMEGMFTDAAARRLRVRMLSALSAVRRPTTHAPIDVVDGYAITAGQCWASQATDGRHYPFLVPMQVMQLLAHVQRRLLTTKV